MPIKWPKKKGASPRGVALSKTVDKLMHWHFTFIPFRRKHKSTYAKNTKRRGKKSPLIKLEIY